jgi:uncharacterized protein (DUF1697 family)
MTTYVAFLRGINVGGKNIIKMDALRMAFEKAGFTSVRTVIQSGNVLFESNSADPRKLEETIETMLTKTFHTRIRALVRSTQDMTHMVSHFPDIFSDDTWKHNVIFISRAINDKNILKSFAIKKDIEKLSYYDGVLYWSARKDALTRSTMIKLSTRKEYQEMTARNINTTQKILALMKSATI